MQGLMKSIGDLFPLWESFYGDSTHPFKYIEGFINIRKCHSGYLIKADPFGDGEICYRPKADYIIPLFEGRKPDFFIIKDKTSPLYKWGVYASRLDGDITLFTPRDDILDEKVFRQHLFHTLDRLERAHSRV